MGWRAFRSFLQSIHLWVGLAFSIPFVLIGLSGSIIVAMQSAPQFMVPSAPARGDMQSIARIIEAAEQVPKGASVGKVNAVVLPQSAGEPAEVQFGQPPGTRPQNVNQNNGKSLYVDPVSLKILGDTERRRAGDFMRTVTTMHIALMFPGYFGLQTVGWMGVAMVLFGISGLILWWPRKGQWRFAFGVKRGARGFRLHRDLHGAVGFWSLFVFLVISISGVDLAFPVTFQATVAKLFPLETDITEPKVDPAVAATIANPEALTPDDAVKLALSVVPNARVLSIQLPPGGGGVYMLAMNPLPFGNGAPQISAFIGPSAHDTSIVDPRSYPIGKRVLMWLRVLHYGMGWGMVWTVLVFLSGFLPLLFAITGLRMWQLKRSQRASLPDALAAPAE
jgi:uncharacterized iron-regulated membrane protein